MCKAVTTAPKGLRQILAASFRADSNQQDAVQILEDSASQLTDTRIQKLDAQHKLKQKEVEALLSKRDAGRLALSLRHSDAQLASLESHVQRLVSAARQGLTSQT